ncbi:hypothetical protein [Streptomyces stelliscabiei]|uniref:hypothetical protein n=1 Tax=Streptomyces stelliscabiei TaxID=146820 RepID=UPI003A923EA4
MLRTPDVAPHFQVLLTRRGRMDQMTVRVEARPGTGADRREGGGRGDRPGGQGRGGRHGGGDDRRLGRRWSARSASSSG